jgi:hypothetical protein
MVGSGLDLGPEALSHQGDDLTGLGVPLQGGLGVDQLTIKDHLEAPL